MKMKNVLIVVLMLSGFLANAQRNFCGTVYDKSMEERLIENKKAFFNLEERDDEWLYIPVHFHIVTKKDGTGGADIYKVLDELCYMNKNYANLKMKFYLSGDFSYIASDKLYSEPSSSLAGALIKTNKKKFKNAVNIFIVNKIPSINEGPGITLGYYTSKYDVLVVRSSQFGVNSKTLSHELGHYFSLAHPFQGWEDDPYDANKHGNPLKILKINGHVIEFMDRSNCEIAADKICDTPPDYNFGITDDGDCKLNGPILDYHKDTIVTMENNYMSYFFGCDHFEFTPMQGSAMRADFKSSKRKHIRSAYVPDTVFIDNAKGKIIEPKNNSTTQYYDDVTLDWDDVPGATVYVVRISLRSQSFKPKFYWVYGESKLVLHDLEKNKRYKWHVRAFNDGNTCGKAFGGYSFKAGAYSTASFDTDAIDELSIYPNPVNSEDIYIKTSTDLGKSNIEIYSIDGKLVETIYADIKKGNNKINLTHSNYQKGIYNMIINTKDNKYIRKVLIEK